jgi:protein-L-isoaspartate(D-aspartate) O-methyltransferase
MAADANSLRTEPSRCVLVCTRRLAVGSVSSGAGDEKHSGFGGLLAGRFMSIRVVVQRVSSWFCKAAWFDRGPRSLWRLTALLLVLATGASAQAPLEARRERMLVEIEALMQQTGGETGRSHLSERVRRAMAAVPRHRFVAEAQRDSAYADRPLPIGQGQTISQPFIVALMTELLDSEPGDRVLEVGTGSGYQTAVLAECVARVFTIEIVRPLGERAAALLAELGYRNIEARIGDGYQGWPQAAPFDRIIVTAAPDHVPQPLIDQLKPGGRMVIPVGLAGLEQDLLVIAKQRDGSTVTQSKVRVRFVPLVRGRSSQ